MTRQFRTAGPRTTRGTIFAIALGSALAAPAAAQCQYEVTAIITAPPCPFTGPPQTVGRGLNIHGHVCGYYDDCEESALDHAFYWTPETGFVTLPEPAWAFGGVATDINDEGLVCGYFRLPSFIHTRAFVYDIKTGAFQHLEPLQEGGSTGANAINNSGVVAGWRSIGQSGNTPYNAMLWDTTTGEVTDLGVMNGPNSWATAITDQGELGGITGTQFTSDVEAWITTNGGLLLLGPVPGGLSSGVNAMSSDHRIAGGTHLPAKPGEPASQGAVWEEGAWQPLPLVPDAIGGTALGINALGQATGRILFAGNPGSINRAALWQHGELHDLAELLTDSSSNVNLHLAIAANDEGQILVRGTAASNSVAFLLQPIGQPIGDLNFDCAVTIYDVVILLEQWTMESRSVGTGPSADLNGDGIVNVFDLLILLSNWG